MSLNIKLLEALEKNSIDLCNVIALENNRIFKETDEYNHAYENCLMFFVRNVDIFKTSSRLLIERKYAIVFNLLRLAFENCLLIRVMLEDETYAQHVIEHAEICRKINIFVHENEENLSELKNELMKLKKEKDRLYDPIRPSTLINKIGDDELIMGYRNLYAEFCSYAHPSLISIDEYISKIKDTETYLITPYPQFRENLLYDATFNLIYLWRITLKPIIVKFGKEISLNTDLSESLTNLDKDIQKEMDKLDAKIKELYKV